MFDLRTFQTILLSAALTVTPAFAGRNHRAPTSGRHHHARHAKKVRHHEVVGQRGIDSARATEIQDALIKQNYLSGAPTGQWDAETQAAMMKYQAANGWQTKLTPDSRALIKLDLGPDRDAGGMQTASQSSNPAVPPPSTVGDNTLASVHSISN